MNQSVKLSKAISYVIAIVAVLLFAAIWPGKVFQQKYVSKSNEIIAMESDPVNVEHNVTQMFVGEGGELSAVDLYVCNDMRGETITFRLYDASYTEIFNTFFVVKDNQEFPGFVHIPVGYDLQKDQEYYFTLEGLTADMTVAYEDRKSSTSIVNGFMSYAGIEIQSFNVIIRYEYSNPFVWWQVLLFAVGITAVAAGLIYCVNTLFAKKFTDKDVKVHTVFKVTLTPVVIVAGSILCLMIFPGRKFGTGVMNYAFYGLGVVLLMAVALFVIWYKRTDDEPLVEWAIVKKRLPEILQALCFAKVIWSCYEYMNGLYDIHHAFAVRKMIIWFLLAMACTYSKKELLRVWNAAYVVIAGIGVYFYAKPYLGVEEEGELYKLQAYILLIGGFVILQLIVKVIRIFLKKDVLYRKWSWPFVLCFGLLIGLMMYFSNGRTWPALALGLFLLFYLSMWLWDKIDRLPIIYANGLILNFVYMVWYSLLHRPYHRYYYYRYGLGFHTVTMTGVYLTLIICAFFAKLYQKVRKEYRLVDMWQEWCLLAVANVYLFLTLSRTGYVAAFVMQAFVIVLLACMQGKKKLVFAGKYFAILLLSSTLFFPIVFTMTRTIPAIVDEPILSDVEMTTHAIKKGTPSDSILYTDLARVMKLAAYKVLGMYQDDFAFRDVTPESLREDYFYPALVEKIRMMMAPDDIHVVNDSILLASNEEGVGDETVLEEMSNGRLDIFMAYIENWNMTGHEEMGVPDEYGNMIVHAHNIYLQMIHDHGLVTGVVFLVFGIYAFALAFARFIKTKDSMYLFAVALLLSFAVAGLAEWIFHICNPFGISVFFAITPLLFRNKDAKVNEE